MKRSLLHSVSLLFVVGIVASAVGLLYSKGSADLAAQDRQPIPVQS